ncbi:hypothetical protein HDV01_005227 [Terramyces sp. JEL0728]|nr:hypothetical protein HDV01_005227 [Terramyces sp. JEL0728]
MAESKPGVVCVGSVCCIEEPPIQEPPYKKADWMSPLLYSELNFEVFNLAPADLKTIVLIVFYKPDDDLAELKSKLAELMEYYGDLGEYLTINLQPRKENTMENSLEYSLDIKEYYEDLGYLETPSVVAIMNRDIAHVGPLKDLAELEQYGDNIKKGFVSPVIGKPIPDVTNANNYVGYVCDEPLNKILIYFWATWCSPCLDTLMKGKELKSQLNELGYSFLPINIDQRSQGFKADMNVVKQAIEKYEFDKSVDYMVDMEDTFHSLVKESQFYGLPCCILVKDGIIKFMGMKEDTLAHLKEVERQEHKAQAARVHQLVDQKFEFESFGLDRQAYSFHVFSFGVLADHRLLQELQEYYLEKGNCTVYTVGHEIQGIPYLPSNAEHSFSDTIITVFLDRIAYIGPLTEQKVNDFKQTALHMQMMACFRRGFRSPLLGAKFPDILSDPTIYITGTVPSGDLCLVCWAMYDPTCIPKIKEFRGIKGYETLLVSVDAESAGLKQRLSKFIVTNGLAGTIVGDLKDEIRVYVQSSMYFMKPCIILVRDGLVEFVGGIDDLTDRE